MADSARKNGKYWQGFLTGKRCVPKKKTMSSNP